MTNFTPAQNGFKFSNSFTNDFIPALDVRTNGLCGGMSYSALDYYYAHMPIPSQQFRPANRTTLQSYLYDRQVTSITSNLDKWAEIGFNPGGIRDTEFFNWGISAKPGERIDELKQFIDAGNPAVLGLQGDGATGNHQVIAFGYDMGRYKGDLGTYAEDFKIFICDPNYPGQTRTLIPDVGRRIYHYQEGGPETWRTYFVDRKYHAQQPPVVPNANYPHDGLIYELILDFFTGNDDLRGENDNVDLVVNLMDGTQQVYRNLNHGARWIVNNDESAEVILEKPVRQEEIKNLIVSTTFRGGLGGDNWDMNKLYIRTLGGGFYRDLKTVEGKRFTGEDKVLTVPINNIPAQPGLVNSLVFTFTTGGDDLRGVNDNVNITIHFRDGGTQRVENVNGGHRWPDNTVQKVTVDLNRPVAPVNIAQIDVETTFSGGIGGDNWDMKSVSIWADNGVDRTIASNGFKRFTGSDKLLTIPVASGSAAAFVSQVVPATMIPGQSYSISVTFKNTGVGNWTTASHFSLGSQNPQDNNIWQTSGRIPLPGDVVPGSSVTFQFVAKAPSSSGTFNFQWRMVQDGVEWFGDFTPNLAIIVAVPESTECVQIRSKINDDKNSIKALQSSLAGLDIKFPGDKIQMNETKNQINQLSKEISDLQKQLLTLGCQP